MKVHISDFLQVRFYSFYEKNDVWESHQSDSGSEESYSINTAFPSVLIKWALMTKLEKGGWPD